MKYVLVQCNIYFIAGLVRCAINKINAAIENVLFYLIAAFIL